MRTIDTALYTLLTAAFAPVPVFPIAAPQGQAAPYVRVTLISSVPVANSLHGTSQETRSVYQVDMFHVNHEDVLSMRETVRSAVRAIPHPAMLDFEFAGYEADARVYRHIMQYVFIDKEV